MLSRIWWYMTFELAFATSIPAGEPAFEVLPDDLVETAAAVGARRLPDPLAGGCSSNDRDGGVAQVEGNPNPQRDGQHQDADECRKMYLPMPCHQPISQPLSVSLSPPLPLSLSPTLNRSTLSLCHSAGVCPPSYHIPGSSASRRR